MAAMDSASELVPSVLDRLIDHDPSVSSEPFAGRSIRIADLKQSVRRDLEWLLNTRRAMELPPALNHLEKSLVAYGLADITSASLSNPNDRSRLRRNVEEAVAHFEPRLIHVRVSIEESRERDRTVRFRIDAALDVDPTPEPVVFDSVLQLHNKSFVIEG
jgi:type VI secretion system protein ImpF